jgi:hypothetical protein
LESGQNRLQEGLVKESQNFIPDLRAAVERAVHTIFDPVAREPLPAEHLALLWRLGEREREHGQARADG